MATKPKSEKDKKEVIMKLVAQNNMQEAMNHIQKNQLEMEKMVQMFSQVKTGQQTQQRGGGGGNRGAGGQRQQPNQLHKNQGNIQQHFNRGGGRGRRGAPPSTHHKTIHHNHNYGTPVVQININLNSNHVKHHQPHREKVASAARNMHPGPAPPPSYNSVFGAGASGAHNPQRGRGSRSTAYKGQ